MKILYEELKRRLAPGFYPDNFRLAAQLAEEASWQTASPLGLYVLSRILFALGEEWGDEGVMETRLADEMRRTMEPAISAYLADAALHDLTPDAEASHLNEIILSFLKWRSAHD